jgi:hypothetical protein
MYMIMYAHIHITCRENDHGLVNRRSAQHAHENSLLVADSIDKQLRAAIIARDNAKANVLGGKHELLLHA